MKKIAVFLVVIFTVFAFAGLTSVYAYPYLEVEGFVDPYSTGTIDDNGTTTTFSEVTYRFNVVTADPLSVDDPSTPWVDPWTPLVDEDSFMNYLSLEFESDVFAGMGSILFDSPADWNVSSMTSSSGNVYELMSAGTKIGLGDKLMFTVSDLVVYNDALIPGNNLWQEGQTWGQSWFSGDDLGGNHGGSTTVVPEPGTLLLFGSGLVGLYYVRRSKVFNT